MYHASVPAKLKIIKTTIQEPLLRLRATLLGDGFVKKHTGGESPLRSELFSTDQTKKHGKTLANLHRLTKDRTPELLLARLNENEGVLVETYNLLSAAVKANERITPAGEWLLDNFYLIEEQIHMAKRHLPKGYSRQLPRLVGGPSAKLPRVYDIALETISHGDGRVDPESLGGFLEVYQKITILMLGELWAIPIMLRLALIENLRRVATRISADRIDRNLADLWVDQMIEVAQKDPKSLILVISDMARSNPPMSTSFIAEFARRLQEQIPVPVLPLTWIKQWLSDSGLTIEQLVQSENQRQAADQVSVSNSIGSLRFLGTMDWREFVEMNSVVERTLRDDPHGIYGKMDFATRDRYRHALEKLAKSNRLSENDVALKAIQLARQGAARKDGDDRVAHVGFYLIDKGLPQLERMTRARFSACGVFRKIGTRLLLPLYLGTIALLTGIVSYGLLKKVNAGILPDWALVGIGTILVISTSQLAVEFVNLFTMLLIKPHLLPRMDFSKGIPAEFRTLVVVPCMLISEQNIETLVEALEVRFLANRDENLHLALLTDFPDAPTEILPKDATLLRLARQKISELNQKYAMGNGGAFFLFHRPRCWNPREQVWMGLERKRGKLADLNSFLRGAASDCFSLVVGETSVLSNVKYVITLDTDTQLPRLSAQQLVGTMAHPLNRARYDEKNQCVSEGYGILQPRVSASLPSVNRSRYSQLYGGDSGIDPYTRTVSDVYQDVFHEGSFIGKGIYDLDMFERVLKGRFPESQILSHDLLEGCYLRSGLLSDVQLYEEYPSGYDADVKRRHRWIRGDWQLAGWLRSTVPGPRGSRQKNPLSRLSQWKILDNLRRSLVPATPTALFLLGWMILSKPGLWTTVLIGIIVAPSFITFILEMLRKPDDVLLSRHLETAVHSTGRSLSQASFTLACLPYEAFFSLDAVARTVVRMLITHKRLLEWKLSADHGLGSRMGLRAAYRRMWVAPLIAVLAEIYLVSAKPSILALVWPILLLWFTSPVIVWWVSRPLATRQAKLTAEQIFFLRKISRKTWAFFETFVGPEDHWLPPDNYQEYRGVTVAHRTSPTNMGLALLVNLSAYDFGYITAGMLIERTANTLRTMETLKRYRGHFYNWYDTQSLKPLIPGYISTVDSGNLAGHLLTLRQGLLALPDQDILGTRLFEGLRDTLGILLDVAPSAWPAPLLQFQENLESACNFKPTTLAMLRPCLEQLTKYAVEIANNFSDVSGSEAGRWAQALLRQCRGAFDELIFTEAGAQANKRIVAIERLAEQIVEMAQMEYGFLYDKTRHLLAIGYNVDERRRDLSYYDLLASEARLCSFVAIAQGQVPQENWFALGRLLTVVNGEPVLLSWSGSMFEYLMPLLVMPTYKNTMLDQTYKMAVKRQIEYGRQHDVPWGTSESGYNAVDVALNYQYRAFGVPGLGLKRRLAEDLVIAPYASILALMVEPEAACSNLQRLADEGLVGKFGFYEAVDYTPARQRPGESSTVIKSFLAHHQGMNLISLANLLLGPLMRKRFESDTVFQATLLLLQERIPKITLFHAHTTELAEIRTVSDNLQAPIHTVNNPNTPMPEVQLLSNGRYHVMVTNAGGGYSRWKDIAVTRWREDTTRDHWGMFCYIRDTASGEFWSTAHQPTLKRTKNYEAIFSEGRAEFRRRDNDFDTHTEIVVSPEDDIELRRVRITNRARTRRTIDVTSYAEVVLTSPAADALHPAFSNLFVQTEIVNRLQAIVCARRARAIDEPTPWMFHLMAVHGADIGQVSYETDRMRFIGRGNSMAAPQAMTVPAALSGSQGSVLDPIVAIRYEITLDPGQSATIDMVSGIGETRQAALSLAEKYHDRKLADRVLELAWTHSQVVLRQINATETDTQLYRRLANSILYVNSFLRADANILIKNRRGQSGLWGYAISGDLPIVLLQIGDAANIDLVRQMVQAHTYWHLKGLVVDLVIWNEDHAGYQQLLQEQILSLIAASVEEKIAHHPGKIFVRSSEQISNEDRILFQSVARVIITDSRGTLAAQLNRHVPAKTSVARLLPTRTQNFDVPTTANLPYRKLIFFNGLGGFTPDGREYVITLASGQVTPAPWVNVLANPQFGTVVSETGVAYTWSENAHEFRLTPWENDPVNDSSGEAFYLRDEENGHFWSPTPMHRRGTQPYVVRHGFGYSVFEHTEDGVYSELWVYVAVDAPVKFSVLKIRNVSGRRRRLSVTGYAEWVLGDLRQKAAMHIITEADSNGGALYARNQFNTEFVERVAFFDASDAVRTFSGDRTEFIGRNGSIRNPAAMAGRHLSGRVGAGLDPCAAIQVPLELADEEEREIIFTLGAGRGMEDAKNLAQRSGGSAAARQALEAVWQYWRHALSAVQVETPDQSLNVLTNGWLVYQTLACRLWARSAHYQSGGAFGFRDQLQDVMALIHTEPRLAREHILLCASRQFQEGDVQHWWHSPSGRGVRTHCSDDYLWLPLATCRYVFSTGDAGILDEQINFLHGRPVNAEEDSYYDTPSFSDEAKSLYEHCTRAILRGLSFGEHGLPLMGSGDWNDGMNLVGQHGKGESVWLGFFLYEVLMQFTKVAQARGDEPFVERCQNEAARLRESIKQNGWDGQWYRRAYFDDGSPLGSSSNPECQIDSISQSWSVLSGAGDTERSGNAMAALDQRLVCRDHGLVQLLDPPFDKSNLNPGYIKGYVPGVRENGGQYTHAAIWAAMAFAKLGDRKRAWELLAMINPVNHTASVEGIATYKVEPYVAAADVYALTPHIGRGGWTWYTGSAGWMYRLIVESLLGVRLEADKLYFSPCIPEDWKEFKVHYRYRETVYHVTVSQIPQGSDKTGVTVDGVVYDEMVIPLMNDCKEHTAKVIIKNSDRRSPDRKSRGRPDFTLSLPGL